MLRRRLMLATLLATGAVAAGIVPTLAATSEPSPFAPWPHSMTVSGTHVTIYEPQAIAWPNHATLQARAALAVTFAGQTTPVIGTILVTAATSIDAATQMVVLTGFSLISSQFPQLDTTQATQLQAGIVRFLATMPPRAVPLDTILIGLNEQPPSAPLNNAPPPIFYSASPAILLVFDGQPTLAPIGQTGLSVALNANWDVVQDTATGGWYLLDDGSWLTAAAFQGPYAPAGVLPAAFSHIPATGEFAPLRQNVPGRPLAAGATPTVFVSTTPAEIIVTSGAPSYKPVPGTGLLVVGNTGATLLREGSGGLFYYLVSGRWFSAASLTGPWSFATGSLPPDFSLIPPDGPYGNLLASVPGTAQAETSVLKAQVPTQASLPRATTKLSVTYAGAPQFQPIPGATGLQYAVNTSYQVILTGGRYYACYQGAWFVAPAPNGPWVLAATVPAAIYGIPPASPLYNVTYVRVYAATPATVTYGFTAGYLLGFATAGILAFGTGFYYPPVVVAGRVPGYFPYPYSYAGNLHYNPATGAWGRGGTVYGPYGAATGGYGYNPRTGTYAEGGRVYGPYGGSGAWSAYNPRTGTYAHGSSTWNAGGRSANGYASNPYTGRSVTTSQNSDVYGHWGASSFSGPRGSVETGSSTTAAGSVHSFAASNGASGTIVHNANGTRGAVVQGAGGNVYAGRDGNAYQHTSNGWSSWNNGGWHPAQTPGARTPGAQQPRAAQPAARSWQPMSSQNYNQLERDRTARSFGGYGGAARGGWGGGGGFRRRY